MRSQCFYRHYNRQITVAFTLQIVNLTTRTVEPVSYTHLDVYKRQEVQLCVIHQIRNSIKYVASKHHKAFMADLKPVYLSLINIY